MKLPRTISYAIQAVLHLALAAPGEPISCRQMARDRRLPERFLLQILRRLVTHGLLQSTRGVVGGYSLARPPQAITLLDIVEAFDNPLDPVFPELESMSTSVRAVVMTTLHNVAHVSRVEMQKLTVADLLDVDRSAPVTTRDPINR